ncbi:MAG TPA: sulfite exporter TauE/SafE family protein [Methanothermococcus okinawensis]|uniref:Probable membrane transporter protein n=1 Tax=Methanothermococcus okinawensis TaxID=155863 RepID=A0A832YN86_9EURY|nr:sulfite exporter TauE/SafE family protein [Methanothermococcus okinawensis]
MNIILISLLVVLGAIIGFITGLLGIGGGFILVPLLNSLFYNMGIPLNDSIKMAVGTSLFVIFLTSTVSTYKHHLQGNILWRCSIVLGVLGIFGSLIGLKISMEYLCGNLHKELFALLLIIISLYGFYSTKGQEYGKLSNNLLVNGLNTVDNSMDNIGSINYKKLCIVGIIVGIISSIFGIGGGIIVIPLLLYLLRFPIKMAIGTSCGMMVLISLMGFLGYMTAPYSFHESLYNVGYVSLIIGLIVGLVATVSSKYGAEISYKIKSQRLKYIFYTILMIVGVKLLLD